MGEHPCDSDARVRVALHRALGRLNSCETANDRFGVCATTVIAFFLAEMGDKTQIATVALAAQQAADVHFEAA